MVGGQQQAAGALALVVWVDSQQGQMVMGGAGEDQLGQERPSQPQPGRTPRQQPPSVRS